MFKRSRFSVQGWGNPTVAFGMVVLGFAAQASAQLPAPGPGPAPGPTAPPVAVNETPVLESFEIRSVIGNCHVAEGQVTDDFPERCVIIFSGALAGYSTSVASDGSFSMSVEVEPGEGGAVNAQAVDDAENYSNVLSAVLVAE